MGKNKINKEQYYRPKKVVKYKAYGNIVCENGRYMFTDRRGHLYDVAQNKHISDLCDSQALCVCSVQVDEDNGWGFAVVDRVMGESFDPIPEGMAIVETYGLKHYESDAVQAAVKRLPTELKQWDYKNRRDLRDVPFITIDPDGAKDFDDAVYAEKLDDGTYILMVAIADVTHYAPKNSVLNDDAMFIGNSSYLGKTVYPMFNEKLSNGICSLNEKCDRVAMCTTAHIDESGNILDYTIEPAVINSRHRLTYKQVDYIELGKLPEVGKLETAGLVAGTMDVRPSIDALFEVSDILEDEKKRRGAISIDSRKAKFVLDDTGTIIDDIDRDHGEVATKVIESTAVLTNELWANAAKRMGIDFVYRNHGEFEAKDINSMNLKLGYFGLHVPDKPTSRSIQKVINTVRGKKCYEPVASIILRGLGNAKYSSTNDGHLGLGIKAPIESKVSIAQVDYEKNLNDARGEYFKSTGGIYGLKFIGGFEHEGYGHTTSPIRRYADDINHSQMKGMIYKGKPEYTAGEIEDICEIINHTERNSAMAEADYDMMLSTLWAKDHIGEVFNCVVVDIFNGEVMVSNEKNLKFYIPFSELNGKVFVGSSNPRIKRDEGDTRPRIRLGDSIRVQIKDVKTNPYKIVATQRIKEFNKDTPDISDDDVDSSDGM